MNYDNWKTTEPDRDPEPEDCTCVDFCGLCRQYPQDCTCENPVARTDLCQLHREGSFVILEPQWPEDPQDDMTDDDG